MPQIEAVTVAVGYGICEAHQAEGLGSSLLSLRGVVLFKDLPKRVLPCDLSVFEFEQIHTSYLDALA